MRYPRLREYQQRRRLEAVWHGTRRRRSQSSLRRRRQHNWAQTDGLLFIKRLQLWAMTCIIIRQENPFLGQGGQVCLTEGLVVIL